MDPEAILDDLTKLSLQQRYKENLVDDLSINSFDDLDNYVRDFQIDDSISECFVSDTETTNRHLKPDDPIRSGKRPKKNAGTSRKHISDLFRRRSKDATKSHRVREPNCYEEKENIYCDMKSCIPKAAYLFNSLPLPPLKPDITLEDDYVLPSQFQPFERITNLIRHNRLRELELELPKYSWDVLISNASRNNILHQCVMENHPQCVQIVASSLPELLFMKNNNGLIPPQLAIQNNKEQCLEVMMSSLSQHDQYVILLAEECIKSDKVECFRIIVENCKNMVENLLDCVTQLAAKYGNISCLQILIEYGVNVWSADNNGQTILEIARDNNNQHCAHYLLILQLSQTLLYSYINTQVFYQRREAHQKRLEELLRQLTLRTDKDKSVNQIKRRLDELLELKEELKRIIYQNNSNGTSSSSTTDCIQRLLQIVEELTDQVDVLQSIWSHQDELQSLCSKHTQSSFQQPPNTENTRLFSQIVKLLKDKTSEEINGIVNRILNGSKSVVESGSEDMLVPNNKTSDRDCISLNQEVTLLSDSEDFVLRNFNEQCDKSYKTDLKHQGIQSFNHFIDGTFPESESKRMNFPLASNLTTNSLREDEICILPSRLILPYVACNSDNNNISPESPSQKLNYTSLNDGSCNELRKFNQINEEVQNVDLHDLKLRKHLEAVRKRENDLVERIVPATRLLNSHQAKQTLDTACIDKHSNSNHHKPKLKWSRKLLRTYSAPDNQLSKSQFKENYDRKPHLKYQSDDKKTLMENKSWKPWYEISEDEKSLQHGQYSDTYSDTSSRQEKYT